jgi:hypothetical protein
MDGIERLSLFVEDHDQEPLRAVELDRADDEWRAPSS